MPALHNVSWEEYGRLTTALAGLVKGAGSAFDVVVGVARGGIPVAMVVADRLGVDLDFVVVKSYSGIGRRSPPRIVAPPLTSLQGKRVLLVDDLVDQGDTMAALKERFATMGAARVETAVLYRKPWSKFAPDYSVESSEEWIVFPFEVAEVKRELESGPKK